MLKSFVFWAHGLVAVFIGGVANSIAAVAVAPESFNLGAQWRQTLTFALISGIISAAAYLKASPLPTLPTTPTTEEKTS